MSEKRTAVDEHRYLFTTEVDRDGFPTFIAVHWTGLSFSAADTFLGPLRDYLRPRHEVSEVWFVFPEDLLPLVTALRASERFGDDGDASAPREYRFFSIDVHGTFHEQLRDDTHPHPVTADTAHDVVQDGLRQLFRDSEALATAAAGFHFTHPSGSHSEHFIRTSQAVSRVHHAYFVAMALLRRLAAPTGDSTIWVDTAAISVVGYAYADLLRRAGITGRHRIETFGGYNGLEPNLRPEPQDIVLVSGSTSGSLARRVISKKKVTDDQVITLFYISADHWPGQSGLVLCDLSDRDLKAHPSVRASRIAPYKTFNTGDCQACNIGSGEIHLDGDSFFPATSELDLRMPSFTERPLRGVSGPGRKPSEITHFDGSNYFDDLLGLDAITFDRGTSAGPSPHGVSTRLGHLFTDSTSPVSQQIIAAAKHAAEGDVVAVVSLLDDDSTALGQMLADELIGAESENNLQVVKDEPATWREWRQAGAASLHDLDGGTILVCAAVLGSGRQFTSVSRDLRKVTGKFHLRYFVAAAHPESSTTWDMLEKTLKRVSDSETSKLNYVWKLPREPRFPGSKTPWGREDATLRTVGAWLLANNSDAHLLAALERRLEALALLNGSTLFMGAGETGVIAQVNAKFALWPFDWTTHDSDAVPTHAEIYATVAHLLYESRRRSPHIESRTITARRHGYALHPAVFDRFNDPVIQAALIRASEPGELNYTTDEDASRAVADLLWFVLSNIGGEAGDAAYEFLLALAEGLDEGGSSGLRVKERPLASLLIQVREMYGDGFESLNESAPHVRALLLYLGGHIARTE
ncbi:hypothetical protein [Microbacterium paraoxydans]|uniref:hypothetical protein n=1 Tax=Microbacterium paraoxydans TaxID=199592 RepID=UPI001CFA35C0|nr:hypothetical protein [Microbacterium paraoxydans]